ncbi:MFS transporter [Burkholderia sp. Cy-637]|uniref:MFS transporter n=1 Tax=Burkholderia sp. Cy-637 TaxID=2608327 RepID=UPI001422E725|nr:MFS transporter [Burkholderia sp. Cy-637]NIF92161.1 MFS transporter [Burkholderia sp. Cy-637]
MDSSRQRMILISTSISAVLVMLDTSIVNVALADMARDLGLAAVAMQWTVNAYVVVFASLPLTGGALGDKLGARRMYIFGLMVFAIGSLACGCASTMPMLIFGRIVQAVGGSLLLPCSLSLLTHAYSDGSARARAIASWSSWGSMALVVGPLIGGVLLTLFSWRGIFLVNLPFCVAGILFSLKVDDDRVVRVDRRLDLPGQITMAIAMVLLTAALVEVSELGWRDIRIWIALVLSGLFALCFIAIERRSASPMLPLTLFSNPTFSLVCYVFLAGAVAFFGMLFVLSLYFQMARSFSPLQTGLALLPLTISIMAGNLLSRRLVSRAGPLVLMLLGTGIRLIGFVVMTLTVTGASYVPVASSLVLVGLGAGLGSPMSTSVFMSAVPGQYSGIASGILRSTGQLGAAIGVAVFGALLVGPRALPIGMSMAALWSAVLTVTIVLVNWHLLRRSRFAHAPPAAAAER